MSDAARREVPKRYGTSHAVFIDGSSLRFFTSAGELPACGHGTVAALAYLSATTGESSFLLSAGGRTFTGQATREGDRFHASFDPGPITVRAADPTPIAAALGLPTPPDDCVVATLGRPRMLLHVPSVEALEPDFDRLRAACDRLGLLGCYAWEPVGDRVRARMFAPSIGVPEDIANANSTACLAAYLQTALTVDMGDALGHPATITASFRDGQIRVGGAAMLLGQPEPGRPIAFP